MPLPVVPVLTSFNTSLPEITIRDDANLAMRAQIIEASQAWLAKSASQDTRSNYNRDLGQFLAFVNITGDTLEKLVAIRPREVAAWRDHLRQEGMTNASIRRKMTVLRSLFSYLQTYGYTGVNPAHGDFVEAPSVSRDGKTVGLSPADCRKLIDAPQEYTLMGVRDRAWLSLLAFTGCRVGELTRLKVGSYKTSGTHKVLEIFGKGGKERLVPLAPEAVERLEAWLDIAGIRSDLAGPLFRPPQKNRKIADGFAARPLNRRTVQMLMKAYVRELGLDAHVTVHSLRVTALTTARERGSDIIDLQEFAGHADPRTTLTYIRTRDRLSKSPAYNLKY